MDENVVTLKCEVEDCTNTVTVCGCKDYDEDEIVRVARWKLHGPGRYLCREHFNVAIAEMYPYALGQMI